jgi:hypothetical protein
VQVDDIEPGDRETFGIETNTKGAKAWRARLVCWEGKPDCGFVTTVY